MGRFVKFNYKRTILLLLWGLLLNFAFFSGCTRITKQKSSSNTVSNAAFTELDEFRPADIILLIDQSGSMQRITDKNGIRKDAARFLTDYIGIYATKYQEHRIGVINFGDNAPQDKTVQLSSVLTQLDSIKSRIGAFDMGNTNFLEAFKTADSLFNSANSYRPSRQPAIVIFTDGEPDIGISRGEALFPGIVDYAKSNFVNRNCPIYVVGIDSENKYWQKDEPYWKAISKSTYRITSVNDLNAVFHEIIADIIGFGWTPVAKPSQGQPTKIEVEPYLERVSFTVLKQNPNVKLKIIRPDGRGVTHKDDDVIYRTGQRGDQFETYSIMDPSPGIWQLQLEGEGEVKIYKDALRLSTTLLNPTSPYPQKRPMEIIVDMARRDGSPLKPLTEYPLHASATIEIPNKTQPVYTELVRSTETSSRFVSTKTIPADAAGTYKVTVSVKGGDYQVFDKTSEINVGEYPYLLVESPDKDIIPVRSNLTVKAKLMMNGNPVNAESLFAEDPAGIAILRLGKAPGLKEPIVDFMKPVIKNNCTYFEYPVNYQPITGLYSANIRLTGKLKDGSIYRSVIETVTVEKKRTILDKISMFWMVFLGIGLIVSLSYIGWSMRLPILKGQIELQGETTNLTRLKGKRMVIGTNKGEVRIGDVLPIRYGYIRGGYGWDDYGRRTVVPELWMYSSTRDIGKIQKYYISLTAIFIIMALLTAVYHWTLLLCWIGISLIVFTGIIYRHNWIGINYGIFSTGDSKQMKDITLTFLD